MKTFLHKREYASETGFSLLELIVVLAIMSILLSLVSVRLFQSIEQANFVKSSRTAISSLQSVRARASLDRNSYLIVTDNSQIRERPGYDEDQIRYFDLPDGIAVYGEPIEILGSGFCKGGRLRFESESGQAVTFDLEAPDCRLKTAT